MQVHWQTGQGDRERRGGEQGPGLGQHDPEGETRGKPVKDKGETGRMGLVSWVPGESWLTDVVTEGDGPSGDEGGIDETCVVMGSDALGVGEEGREVGAVNVVVGLEGPAE